MKNLAEPYILKSTEKFVHMHFKSLSDFGDLANSEDEVAIPNSSRSSRKDRDADWSGTGTWEDAYKQITHGWEEGLKHVEAVSPSHKTSRSGIEYRPEGHGHVADLGKVAVGRPDSMLRRYNVNRADHRKGKFLHLAVNFGHSASVKSQNIINRGAVIMSVVDALENKGYRVRITSFMGVTDGRSKPGLTTVIMKDYEHHLNREKAAFALISPAMLRRVWFGASEMEEHHRKELNCNGGFYGTPISRSELEKRDFKKLLGDKNAVIIHENPGSSSMNVYSDYKKGRAEIIKQIEEQTDLKINIDQ